MSDRATRINLENASEELINPATEDSLDKITPATGWNGDKVSVGTTAVEMTFTGTTKAIMIQADWDNTGTIWIGDSNITSAGLNAHIRLEAGDSIQMDLNDASAAVYAVSDTALQNVYKLALT